MTFGAQDIGKRAQGSSVQHLKERAEQVRWVEEA